MSVPGRCTELNSLVTVLGSTLKWQGMRGMMKNPYNETLKIAFLCTSDHHELLVRLKAAKLSCDLLTEEKLFFLEDCFQDCNSGRECSLERCYLLSEQQSSCIVSW